LDPRSLAIFRFALGWILFTLTLSLWSDFAAFYGQDGVMPPPAWMEPLLEIAIFVVLPLASLTLLAGFLTRLSTLICFAALVLVQDGNQLILQGGDVLLRILLFWSLFLPLGETWSLDVRLGLARPWALPLTVRLATWALTLQVCFVYWFSALLKTDPLWTQNGNALFYALNVEHLTSPLGLSFRPYHGLLRVASFATPWFELLAPCLLLSPIRRDVCRMAAVVLFVGFHLIGIQALMRVGHFPWVCAAAWIVFIPAFFWDGLKTRNEPLRINQPPGPALDYAVSIFIALSFLDVVIWNISSLHGETADRWLRARDPLARVIRLDQHWRMYAPAPSVAHGWVVVLAYLADDSQVDLFTGQPVSWEKPHDIGAYFGNDRWRKYISNLFDKQDPQALEAYADYMVRHWNKAHGADQQVEGVTLTFMQQRTQPDLTVTAPEKVSLYFHAY
jgi:hypothetical protein